MAGASDFGGDRRAGEFDVSNSGSSNYSGASTPQIMTEQVCNAMEQTTDVPVPKIVEESVQGVQSTHQERFSERSVTDCRCASVSDLKRGLRAGEIDESRSAPSLLPQR